MSSRRSRAHAFVDAGLNRLERRARTSQRINRVGRWVRNIAGIAALSIPALSLLPALQPPPKPDGHPDPDKPGYERVLELLGEIKVMISKLEPGAKDSPTELTVVMPQPTPGPAPGPGSSQPQSINVTAALPPLQGTVFLAPLERRWYQTSLGADDLFWALPSADFKLSAGGIQRCTNIEDCSVTLLAETAGTTGAVPLLSTSGAVFRSATRGRGAACSAADDLGVSRCVIRLTGAGSGSSAKMCLWLRQPQLELVESSSASGVRPKLRFDIQWGDRFTDSGGLQPASCTPPSS